MTYKIGDRVVKARPYSKDEYCRNGGTYEDFPLTAIGTVKNVSEGNIQIEFDDYGRYGCDESEIDYFDKPKPLKVIQFKAGTKITNYVKELLKKETDPERVKWLRTFDNCILPEKVRNLIDESITIVLRADMFEKWGLNDNFEKGLTNSIMIYGPSGTGKTMVSESIAAVLGKNLMKLDSGVIQSNVPGQTERNIEKAFKEASDKDCVLLLDECDSLLYNRNAVGSILSSEINKLLTEIERFSGVVILTTNRLHKLDEALQRRIIAKVELPLPNEEARNLIWKKLIPKKMPVKELDYKELSQPNISGGDIKNAIILAARKAIAKNQEEVHMDNFREALLSILEAKEDYNKVIPKCREETW